MGRLSISDTGEDGEEMHRQRLAMLIIILVGGTAVMVSYIYPIMTQPQYVEPAWGGVTPDIRRFYAPSMLLASAGLDRLLHHAEVMVMTGTSFRADGGLQLEQKLLIAQQAVS